MKIKKYISEYLKKDKIQRLIYLGILLLWGFIGINFMRYKGDSSPIKIDMVIMMTLPSLLLIGQILFNKIIFWIGNFGFSVFHFIFTIYKITFDYITDLNSVIDIKSFWSVEDKLISILLIIISFFITWLIWEMKPQKKTLRTTPNKINS